MVNLILASPLLHFVDWFCLHLPKIRVREIAYKEYCGLNLFSDVGIAPD